VPWKEKGKFERAIKFCVNNNCVMDTTASLLLKKQLAELNKHPVEGEHFRSLPFFIHP
jgi:hypothetical protein